MHMIERIAECRTLAELDGLREEIHFEASLGEIDFKAVKGYFLKKQAELKSPKVLREKNRRRAK